MERITARVLDNKTDRVVVLSLNLNDDDMVEIFINGECLYEAGWTDNIREFFIECLGKFPRMEHPQ